MDAHVPPAAGYAEAVDYGVVAMDFVDRIGALKSKAAIVEAFGKAVAAFGFDYFAMASLLDVDRPLSVLMAKPPIGWTEFYIERNYQLNDPVIQLCGATSRPFGWNDLTPQAHTAKRAMEIMGHARDFGLVNGLTIPIHGFEGSVSCVSLSASSQPFLNRHTKPALHLMAIYAFEQARQLFAVDQSLNPLTPREREVLTWAAAGKSAAGIAAILNVTERTAVAHTVNATQKLGAANKTQAVAIALRNRLINL